MNSPEIKFALPELESAAQLVHQVIPPTPQYNWPKLSRRAGCAVWVKHENHTPTGAFKVRGGLATREPHPEAIEIICRGAARVVEVSERAIADAVRIYFDYAHQLAEGAGAAPLAALLGERPRMANKKVALILSGGNLERARYLQVPGDATPAVG